AVDPDADEALAAKILEQLPELAFPTPDEGREDLDPAPLGPAQNPVRDLRGRLAHDRAAAPGTVRRAAPRPEQAQVVVDLRDRADRRTRIPARRLLLDRDRRREPLDSVHVRLLHHAEELPGV